MSTIQIKSHLPGVFYRKSSPESPPYKEDGDNVLASDTIGLVEVMKSFHEVKANVDGSSIKFILDDASPVTAGQVLAEIEE